MKVYLLKVEKEGKFYSSERHHRWFERWTADNIWGRDGGGRGGDMKVKLKQPFYFHIPTSHYTSYTFTQFLLLLFWTVIWKTQPRQLLRIRRRSVKTEQCSVNTLLDKGKVSWFAKSGLWYFRFWQYWGT